MNAVAFPTPIALVVGLPRVDADACSARLRLAGYQVARAAHGPAACDQTRQLRPCLIVVSRSLWALERRAVDSAAAAVAADVVDHASLEHALRR